ncbi:MAG: ferredoxin [Candidatus Woesearchaeota archaeon]
MVRYKIIFDRENCIGAGACAAMAPEHFKMVEDGKADLIGSKDLGNGKFELDTEANDNLVEAAKACPVLVIKIKNEEGKDLV